MTKVIAAVKNSRITESIKETISNIFGSELQEDESTRKVNLPDSKKIVRSQNLSNDEYGYFNRMENL